MKGKKMKKIILVTTVLVVVVCLILSMSIGCKKESQETTAAETTAAETTAAETTAAETTAAEPIEITLWMFQNEKILQYVDELANLVKEKYNITIKFEGQTWDVIDQNLTASIMAQSGPDIIVTEGGRWSSAILGIASNDGVIALNDIIPGEMYEKFSAWSGATDSDGKFYGVPIFQGFVGLSFNKDLFDKAGINYGDKPKLWYWDEFIDTCKKLKEAGITPISFANKEGYMVDWWFEKTLPGYYDDNGEMAKYITEESMNSQPFIDIMEKNKFLYDEEYFF